MAEDPNLPPLVVRVAPPPPRPGFVQACVLTFGYWVALIGGMLAVVGLALLFGNTDEAHAPANESGHPVAKLAPALRTALAWSVPAGYFAGLLYSILALRIVAGRSWRAELGLTRLPIRHLLLGLLALPGFILLSDLLARLVHPVDGAIERLTGFRGFADAGLALQALFEDFHWSFAVLAIGVGPGVVEELWCRGFLGRGLLARYGPFAGIAMASGFFGLLHLWPPSYVIVTAAMGACLHLAYLASRSLWVPIAMHALNNSFAVLVALGGLRIAALEARVEAHPVVAGVASAGWLAGCGLAMWRWRVTAAPPLSPSSRVSTGSSPP